MRWCRRKRGAHMALSLERLEALDGEDGCSGLGCRRRRGRWRRWRGFWAGRRVCGSRANTDKADEHGLHRQVRAWS